MSQSVAALDAYLQLIARQGASRQTVDERRRLLLKLLPHLAQLPSGSDSYRAVVDGFVADSPRERQVLLLTCAREYYYFWLGNMKKVVEITARAGFTLFNPVIPMAADLAELRRRMAEQGFSRFPPSLDIYLGKLFEDGVDDALIRERESLLKPLLYLLDGLPFSPGSYRMAVDALLLHLGPADDPGDCLRLVREFFYYWQSFPHARQRGGEAG